MEATDGLDHDAEVVVLERADGVDDRRLAGDRLEERRPPGPALELATTHEERLAAPRAARLRLVRRRALAWRARRSRTELKAIPASRNTNPNSSPIDGVASRSNAPTT